MLLVKRPLLFAGYTLVLGLSAAAWGLAVNDPWLNRTGVVLIVWGVPFVLVFRKTWASTPRAIRVNALLALAWAVLAVSSLWLWRWAFDPVYANLIAGVCGVHALMLGGFVWIAVKYPEATGKGAPESGDPAAPNAAPDRGGLTASQDS